MMRVLSVRQPWAWAIVHGGKDVENRSRNLAGGYRGPVAIHAGKSWDEEAPLALVENYLHASRIEQGAIIGVVDLVGVHRGLAPTRSRMTSVDSCFRPGKPYGPCSPWAEPHAVHLELANPRPLTAPIPFRGTLGLRTLPAEVEAEILHGLEAA